MGIAKSDSNMKWIMLDTRGNADLTGLNRPKSEMNKTFQVLKVQWHGKSDSKMAWPEEGVGRVEAVGMETVPCTPLRPHCVQDSLRKPHRLTNPGWAEELKPQVTAYRLQCGQLDQWQSAKIVSGASLACSWSGGPMCGQVWHQHIYEEIMFDTGGGTGVSCDPTRGSAATLPVPGSAATLPTHTFRFWGLGLGDLGFRGGTWGQPFRFWGLGQGDSGFRGLGQGDLGFRVGDNPLGGWDLGTWGLGVGLGDNPLGGWDLGFRGGTWGQPFRGLGLGDLGFRGGAWGQPFRDKGTCGLGVGLGDNPLGFVLGAGTRGLGV